MAKLIQFTHPQVEHTPLASSIKGKQTPYHFPWNNGTHKRKFLKGKGKYLLGSLENWQECEKDDLCFWCEAEWDTSCRPINDIPKSNQMLPSPMPTFVHSFVSKGRERPGKNGVNTDPYIFGDYFKYTLCRQENHPSLRKLKQNDIIIFGSYMKCLSQNSPTMFAFFVDTVFVVNNTVRNIPQGIIPSKSIIKQSNGLITPDYYRRTLERLSSYDVSSTNSCAETNINITYEDSCSCNCSSRKPSNSSNQLPSLSLYSGIMYSSTNNSLFSFVPIRPDSQCYPRPLLNSLMVKDANGKMVNAIKPNPGPTGIKITEISSPQQVWCEIVKHFLKQGYSLGVDFQE